MLHSSPLLYMYSVITQQQPKGPWGSLEASKIKIFQPTHGDLKTLSPHQWPRGGGGILRNLEMAPRTPAIG